MPIKKDMWDLVSKKPRPKYENPGLWAKNIKENRMAIGKVQQIIRESVRDQIPFNIIDLKDSKKMWDKLKSICNKIDQEVVYFIF